jgi:predicted Zn-dependent protease
MTAPTTDPLVDPRRFDRLADALCTDAAVQGLDRVSLSLSAESSDFIRFNHARVRQATQVRQAEAVVAVVRGARRAEGTVTLTGDTDADIERLREERGVLADALAVLPDDPYLLLAPPSTHSHRDIEGRMPAAADVVRTVAEAADGHDLVGFHAAGPIARAYADSTGSRHWHRTDLFHMEWCLYAPGGADDPSLRDKAIKTAWAGTAWSADELAGRIAAAAARVPLLTRPPRRLSPGPVRAAFSVAAMAELVGMLGWSGFSARDRRLGTSALVRLAGPGDAAEGLRLDPRVTVQEAIAAGGAPLFNPEGFVRPDVVPLIDRGRDAGALASPRTAREHGLPATAADEGESPQALSMAPGDLPAGHLLQALGTGLLVSNLWYLNWSDRQAARITGMTRFACFWVEDGEPVAPVPVMRFDDSAFRIFGEGLVALTDTADRIADGETYGGRRLASVTVPAAVVDGFRLVL